MAVTDYRFAGTVSSAWTNPSYAKADDTNYATAQFGSKGGTSDPLLLTNFGFTSTHIPDGSTIDGIEVVISRSASSANQITDATLYCYISSATTGSNLASATKWPTSITDANYGGATNLWGWSPTQANILSSGFGISLTVSSPGAYTAYVDYIKIRVYYTEGGGGGIVVPVFLYHYMNHC